MKGEAGEQEEQQNGGICGFETESHFLVAADILAMKICNCK